MILRTLIKFAIVWKIEYLCICVWSTCIPNFKNLWGLEGYVFFCKNLINRGLSLIFYVNNFWFNIRKYIHKLFYISSYSLINKIHVISKFLWIFYSKLVCVRVLSFYAVIFKLNVQFLEKVYEKFSIRFGLEFIRVCFSLLWTNY